MPDERADFSLPSPDLRTFDVLPANRLITLGIRHEWRLDAGEMVEYGAAPVGTQAPVAQLDRALPSEGKGREFESRRVRHFP